LIRNCKLPVSRASTCRREAPQVYFQTRYRF